MTIQNALREGHNLLFYAEVDTPVLDATVLLGEALNISKERIFASLPEVIDRGSYQRYRDMLERRCSGIPVSYIRNKKEFFGLEFYVDERVLVPRPDTETLVEALLGFIDKSQGPLKIHDTCTGSGCVAITVKLKNPDLDISASDISLEAGEVFAINSYVLLGYQLPCYRSDLLQQVPGSFDLISANPPYLLEREVDNLGKIGWPEPELALRGGIAGTALALKLITDSALRLKAGGAIFLEGAAGQMERLEAHLLASGYSEIEVFKDLGGRERVISARWRRCA